MARIFKGLSILLIVCFLFSVTAIPASAEGVDCADTATTGVPQVECEALVAIYNSTNGPGWTNSSSNNWLTHTAISTWSGVVVTDGHVTGMLNLSYNNLSGPLPPEIGDLQGVTYFYFRNNQITGIIPPEIAEVSGLLYLYLNYNDMTGEIPAQLFSLPNIEQIMLHENHLNGQIPAEIGNAPMLTRLRVDNNDLMGELPAGIGNLTNLTIFNINDNDLFGPIPTGIKNLTSVSSLEIGNNGLWTTDAATIAFLDSKNSSWSDLQSAQGLFPLTGHVAGWGGSSTSPYFSPKLVFSQFFKNDGVAAAKYRINIWDLTVNQLTLSKEIFPSGICGGSDPTIASVCTYVPALSDFTYPVGPGDYWWTVDTWDGTGWANCDAVRYFTIVPPPNVLYPTADTTRINPTFKWVPVIGAERYNLVVWDSWHKVLDATFYPDYCTLSMCTYALPTSQMTLANGDYTWLVRADMGNGDYTDWGDATFTKVAPPAPKFPAVSSTTPNPKFTWTPVAGQTRYQLELRTSAGVLKLTKTLDSTVCNATLCSYTNGTSLGLLNGVSYKWKVGAGDTEEWGSYSAFKTFNKVAPPAPVTPTGTITATNPKFTWKKIPGATKYMIELKKTSGTTFTKTMEATTFTCNTLTCWYTPSSPVLNLAKGDYKWKVRAFNGYYGWYSGYKLFTRK